MSNFTSFWRKWVRIGYTSHHKWWHLVGAVVWWRYFAPSPGICTKPGSRLTCFTPMRVVRQSGLVPVLDCLENTVLFLIACRHSSREVYGLSSSLSRRRQIPSWLLNRLWCHSPMSLPSLWTLFQQMVQRRKNRSRQFIYARIDNKRTTVFNNLEKTYKRVNLRKFYLM
jgi:hypothetical protein